jgi:hypothetical protein
MATAIRRIAGPKLATAAVAAEFMRRRFGEKMGARRKTFESLRDSVPPSSEPLSLKPSEMELLEPSEPTLALSKTPPLPLVHPEPHPPPPKKPRLVLEGAGEPVEPEPETRRRPSMATPPGLGPVTAPSGAPRPPTPAPPTVAPQVSLPPPTISPIDEASAVDHYRRQMPTFPTFEEEPPRRRVAVRGIVTAGAMGLTFVLGWWVGRTFAPAPDVRQAACASATAQLVAQVPQAAPQLAAVPAPLPVVSASAQSSATVPSATASVVASTASAPPANSTPPAPVATTLASPRSAATEHAPVVVAPRPTATAPVAPPATTAPAPKPTGKPGGYVPEEL